MTDKTILEVITFLPPLGFKNAEKYLKYPCVCGAVPNQPCLKIRAEGIHRDRINKYNEDNNDTTATY